MSPPAEKARPAPVKTMQPTASSASTFFNSCWISSIIARFIALSLSGRLNDALFGLGEDGLVPKRFLLRFMWPALPFCQPARSNLVRVSGDAGLMPALRAAPSPVSDPVSQALAEQVTSLAAPLLIPARGGTQFPSLAVSRGAKNHSSGELLHCGRTSATLTTPARIGQRTNPSTSCQGSAIGSRARAAGSTANSAGVVAPNSARPAPYVKARTLNDTNPLVFSSP